MLSYNYIYKITLSKQVNIHKSDNRTYLTTTPDRLRVLGVGSPSLLIRPVESCDATRGRSKPRRDAYLSINGFRPYISGSTLPHLIDISLDHNIEQTIDKPTRGGNILDLLFTNNKSTLQNVVIMPPLGKSDHDIIYAEITVRPNRMSAPHRKVFVFRKADWDGIKRKLNALFEKRCKKTPNNPQSTNFGTHLK